VGRDPRARFDVLAPDADSFCTPSHVEDIEGDSCSSAFKSRRGHQLPRLLRPGGGAFHLCVRQGEVPAQDGRIVRVYDAWAHVTDRTARRACLETAAVRDGENVLAVAVGAGFAFRELVRANPSGLTEGAISPRRCSRERTRRSLRSRAPPPARGRLRSRPRRVPPRAAGRWPARARQHDARHVARNATLGDGLPRPTGAPRRLSRRVPPATPRGGRVRRCVPHVRLRVPIRGDRRTKAPLSSFQAPAAPCLRVPRGSPVAPPPSSGRRESSFHRPAGGSVGFRHRVCPRRTSRRGFDERSRSQVAFTSSRGRPGALPHPSDRLRHHGRPPRGPGGDGRRPDRVGRCPGRAAQRRTRVPWDPLRRAAGAPGPAATARLLAGPSRSERLRARLPPGIPGRAVSAHLSRAGVPPPSDGRA
jgi:hypothetical protein